VDCPICKSLLSENALFCTQCGQPQTVNPRFFTRPKIPIWVAILRILALMLIIKIVINHPINQKKADKVQNTTPAATGVSRNPRLDGKCYQAHGTPGQAGFAVTTWHPRADGLCYTADAPDHAAFPPPQPRIFK
jgi:hypothetical protein